MTTPDSLRPLVEASVSMLILDDAYYSLAPERNPVKECADRILAALGPKWAAQAARIKELETTCQGFYKDMTDALGEHHQSQHVVAYSIKKVCAALTQAEAEALADKARIKEVEFLLVHRGQIIERQEPRCHEANQRTAQAEAEAARLREELAACRCQIAELSDAKLVEWPPLKHKTLHAYFEAATVIDFTLRAERMEDGGYHFYIHPAHVSGATEDFLIWPDPFKHYDMLINRLEIPEPDVEKFKERIAAQQPKP